MSEKQILGFTYERARTLSQREVLQHSHINGRKRGLDTTNILKAAATMVQVIYTETEQQDLVFIHRHYQVVTVSLAVFLLSLFFTKLNTWSEQSAARQVEQQERDHVDLCVQWS
jgi:hypothetical protein